MDLPLLKDPKRVTAHNGHGRYEAYQNDSKGEVHD